MTLNKSRTCTDYTKLRPRSSPLIPLFHTSTCSNLQQGGASFVVPSALSRQLGMSAHRGLNSGPSTLSGCITRTFGANFASSNTPGS